jgi:hypothetical protein
MSKEIINYNLGVSYSLCDGTAFNDDGDAVKVEFVNEHEHEGERLLGPYVTVDGVLCKATGINLWAALLSFWATPMSPSDCLADMRQREDDAQIKAERLLQSTSQN